MIILKVLLATLFFTFYFIDMARLPERWNINFKPFNCNMCLAVYVAIILYLVPVIILNIVLVGFMSGVFAPMFRNLFTNLFFKK
jgi:hypothetical protein